MPTDANEIEVKGIAGDLSGGLIQSALASRYVASRQSVGAAIKRGTITQWLEKQGKDFEGICWRYDSEKKLFFPLD